jgi:hypothetical protein
MVLLNLETGIYFGLDPVGTRIWTLLREHESLQQVFEVLLQEYDVPEPVLKADLLRLARNSPLTDLPASAARAAIQQRIDVWRGAPQPCWRIC